MVDPRFIKRRDELIQDKQQMEKQIHNDESVHARKIIDYNGMIKKQKVEEAKL